MTSLPAQSAEEPEKNKLDVISESMGLDMKQSGRDLQGTWIF
jgi:hypothetical protein